MANREDTTGIYGRWADRDNADRFHGPRGRHYYAVTYADVNEPYPANEVAGISGMNGPQNEYGFDRGFYNADPQHPRNDPYNDAFFEPVYMRRERARHAAQANLPVRSNQQPMPVRAYHPELPEGHMNPGANMPSRLYPENDRHFWQQPGQWQQGDWHSEPLPNPAYNNDGYFRQGQHHNAAQMPPRYQEPWPRQEEPYKLNGPYRGTPNFNLQRPWPNEYEQRFGFNGPDRYQDGRRQGPPWQDR